MCLWPHRVMKRGGVLSGDFLCHALLSWGGHYACLVMYGMFLHAVIIRKQLFEMLEERTSLHAMRPAWEYNHPKLKNSLYCAHCEFGPYCINSDIVHFGNVFS